jgi:hypothetical protein
MFTSEDAIPSTLAGLMLDEIRISAGQMNLAQALTGPSTQFL